MRKPEKLLTDLDFVARNAAILATHLHVYFEGQKSGIADDLRARMFKDYAVRALNMQQAARAIREDIESEQVEEFREELLDRDLASHD